MITRNDSSSIHGDSKVSVSSFDDRKENRSTRNERIKQETAKITEKSRKFKESYSKKIESEFNAKFHKIEQNRLDQVVKWRIKTGNNPLIKDQYDLELKREDIFTRRCDHEHQQEARKHLVESLDGHLNVFHDICPPDKIKALSIVDERHAMEYRRTKLEAKLLRHEEQVLSRLIREDVDHIARTMPNLPWKKR